MKKSFKFSLAAVVAALSFLSGQIQAAEQTVKYVFLFIGDGMSMPQRMLANEYSEKLGKGKLFINTMPYQAPTRTNSANAFITDSAASGTAIACGEKTVNGCIGMDAARKRNLESIAAVAKKSGRKVGIVSTMTINHATPAAFYAHNPSRGNYYNIALDLINSDFDYFGGGGAAANDDKKASGYQGNVYDLAAGKGYTVLKGRQAIMSAKPGSGKIWAVGANGYLPYAIDRSENDVSLAEFVQQAITLLDNEKGFFIMAEGGKIDVVCHANDAGTALHETLDFNDAVKVAYEFALKHPDETLIVVTGDHETGGLQLGFAGTGYKSGTEYLQLQKCSIDKLDELLAQVANGKDKVVFDDVKGLINQYFGMYFPGQKMPEGLHFELNDKEVKELEKAFNRQYPNGKYKKGRIMSPGIIRCFNAKCSLSWTTGGHTAMPVLTSAYGKKAEMFTGLLDNTEISRKLKQVVR